MRISDQDKIFIKIFLAVLWGVLGLYVMVKNQFTCDGWANNFRDSFNCNIVLTQKSFGSGIATLKGIDLVTKKEVTTEEGTKWLIDNFDTLKIGDTIIKKRGKYTILIKRKGRVFVIPMTCNEKV
jgi:ribosomal protein L36